MADYSKKEMLEEHTETHLDLLLKIASLQEKGLQDETQNLELMKALTAKNPCKRSAPWTERSRQPRHSSW